MLDDEEVRRRLVDARVAAWEGDVHRHMFAGILPDRENVRGARWNPPGVAAIYTALKRDTALAEADYRLSLETVPVHTDIRRTIYKVHVSLNSVVDLSEWSQLESMGITKEHFTPVDKSALRQCQQLGGAVEWHEHDGLLVPSARGSGANLVIYPSNHTPGYKFEVQGQEDIS